MLLNKSEIFRFQERYLIAFVATLWSKIFIVWIASVVMHVGAASSPTRTPTRAPTVYPTATSNSYAMTTYQTAGGLARSVWINTAGFVYLTVRTPTCVIYKYTSSFVLSATYGNGSCNTYGTAATSASFNVPISIWGDTGGTLYVTESNSFVLRKISTSLSVSLFAGTVNSAATQATATNGDNGQATSAKFVTPVHHIGDSNGVIYVADRDAYKVRKISSSGIITTFAGTGVQGQTSSSGAATSVTLDEVRSVWVNSNGVVYIGELSTLRMVSTAGIMTTLSPTSLDGPKIYGDSVGNLFITDVGNQRIRKLTASGSLILIAGSGTNTGAIAADPYGCYVDTAGVVYFTAENKYMIYALTPIDPTITPTRAPTTKPTTAIPSSIAPTSIAPTRAPTTVAPTGPSYAPTLYPTGTSNNYALGTHPTTANVVRGLWVNSVGELFLTSRDECYIYKYTPSFELSAVYGDGDCETTGTAATSAAFDNPAGIWGDSEGNLFVAEQSSYVVRKISTSLIVSVYAGTTNTAASDGTSTNGDGGAATSATFMVPVGVVGDSVGNVYIADREAAKVRKVDSSGIISTVAGSGVSAYTSTTGPATSTSMQNAKGLWVSSGGYIYIAENTAVKVVDSAGIMSDLLVVALNGPRLWGDTLGSLFIVDSGKKFVLKYSTTGGGAAATMAGTGSNVDISGAPNGCFVDTTGVVYYAIDGGYMINTLTPIDPTAMPTRAPTMPPTVSPTAPSWMPTAALSTAPSSSPTVSPTTFPTMPPTGAPTFATSTLSSSVDPSFLPTALPAFDPSIPPTQLPSIEPSSAPSAPPPVEPSVLPGAPSIEPSVHPTRAPTPDPSISLTQPPSITPSASPSTEPSQMPSPQPSLLPSMTPSTIPTAAPSAAPSSAPTSCPTIAPSASPSAAPSATPTMAPSCTPSFSPLQDPSSSPSMPPSVLPTVSPTSSPTRSPTALPTVEPTIAPTVQPTYAPSLVPTALPSDRPSVEPSPPPTTHPTDAPSSPPTTDPTDSPTTLPSNVPTVPPTQTPSSAPSSPPSLIPSAAPSSAPSATPSHLPSDAPTSAPSANAIVISSTRPSFLPSVVTGSPSDAPSAVPSLIPSVEPSVAPTAFPTTVPSKNPSAAPTWLPSAVPSFTPSQSPTGIPTACPSSTPSLQPSAAPTAAPSAHSTQSPTIPPTMTPSRTPTNAPSCSPTTLPSVAPSAAPSSDPTRLPSSAPTIQPSTIPTMQPSLLPTTAPTACPTTAAPSHPPSPAPSPAPSASPIASPTSGPSVTPTESPSTCPTVAPTCTPTIAPTTAPSASPSTLPTNAPSGAPSPVPSIAPSLPPSQTPVSNPTAAVPSEFPTEVPSMSPSVEPSSPPTIHPTVSPSMVPSGAPSIAPTTAPANTPSSAPTVCPSSLPPTATPTQLPTLSPTMHPSVSLSVAPSTTPSSVPTPFPSSVSPSRSPSHSPTLSPTGAPTPAPSLVPSSSLPSASPTTAAPSPRPVIDDDNSLNKFPSDNGISVVNALKGRQFTAMLPSQHTTFISGSGFSNITFTAVVAVDHPSFIVYGNPVRIANDTSNMEANRVEQVADVLAGDYSGRSFSTAGDVNDDGFEDLIIGVPFASVAYVMFGTAQGFVNMRAGFVIHGASSSDQAGWSVYGAGDVNGDGVDDIILGAPYAKSANGVAAGAAYILFGSARQRMRDVYLDSLDNNTGVAVQCTALLDYCGVSVSTAGDLNGDGYGDVAIGFLKGAGSYAGGVHVVYGRGSSDWSSISIGSSLASSVGATLSGDSWSWSGYSLSHADVNGDGVSDLIVGSLPWRGSYLTQKTYIVLGSPGQKLSSGALSTAAWAVINRAGSIVYGVADVNGDGSEELLLVRMTSFGGGGVVFVQPTAEEITASILRPSASPTLQPVILSTAKPTSFPSGKPSMAPSYAPVSAAPTGTPTAPTLSPTETPTGPSVSPTIAPSVPTVAPSAVPSYLPTSLSPTAAPSEYPTVSPTDSPISPTRPPTTSPSFLPSRIPTTEPFASPSHAPLHRQTRRPSVSPTIISPGALSNGTLVVDTGGNISRSDAYGTYVLNSTRNIWIVGASLQAVFQILPIPNVTYTIQRFNNDSDKIDLRRYPSVYAFSDLNITAGSVFITFRDQQRIRIQNHNPHSIGPDNFIFAEKSLDGFERLVIVGTAMIVIMAAGVAVMFLLWRYHKYLEKEVKEMQKNAAAMVAFSLIVRIVEGDEGGGSDDDSSVTSSATLLEKVLRGCSESSSEVSSDDAWLSECDDKREDEEQASSSSYATLYSVSMASSPADKQQY